jgi:hypothetical protein
LAISSRLERERDCTAERYRDTERERNDWQKNLIVMVFGMGLSPSTNTITIQPGREGNSIGPEGERLIEGEEGLKLSNSIN